MSQRLSFLFPHVSWRQKCWIAKWNVHCVDKNLDAVCLDIVLSYALQKLFRNAMLFHFLNVLLQVLLHKSHDLLQDDITLALYNMAAVDFPAFYSSFLPEFLNGCQGLDPHQRTTLARHFTPERVWTPEVLAFTRRTFCSQRQCTSGVCYRLQCECDASATFGVTILAPWIQFGWFYWCNKFTVVWPCKSCLVFSAPRRTCHHFLRECIDW